MLAGYTVAEHITLTHLKICSPLLNLTWNAAYIGSAKLSGSSIWMLYTWYGLEYDCLIRVVFNPGKMVSPPMLPFGKAFGDSGESP